MKINHSRGLLLILVGAGLLALSLPAWAQEADDVAVTETAVDLEVPVVPDVAAPDLPEATPANKLIVYSKDESAVSFVVFLPEQIDTEWFWYYYTETEQHIVQSLVEKKLIDAGYEVIDISMANLDDESFSIEDVTSPRNAVQLARKLGATYAIVGKASASQAGNTVAYGINVIRAGAEASARIVQVSDGKIIAVEEASSKGGGQAQKMAAQGALKEAGRVLADRLASRLNLLLAP